MITPNFSAHSLKITIIGGGAGGFFAGITCARQFPQAEITILEAGSEVLSKVKISGGGRCNVTHACFDPAQLIQFYPRGGKSLRGAFTRFQPKDTIQWFKSRGVELKIEDDGRIFPITDDSQTIIDCFLDQAKKLGITIKTRCPVIEINKEENGFIITTKKGEIFRTDRVLIATGNNPLGYRWAKQMGHSIETPVPSLFTFTIRDRRLQDLAGVSVEDVHIQLKTEKKNKLEQRGSLLITHWGISGPAVLKLSAYGARFLYEQHYQTNCIINWLPEYNLESIKPVLLSSKEHYSKRKIISACPVNLPKRLWQKLVEYGGISPEKNWADLSKNDLNTLVQELVQGIYPIGGKGVFKDEFVTCGGVVLKEVDFKTMESKVCPGLFFAGEILDIDGVTGGFNFQSAWTTGSIAGASIGC